jgi:SAM-dependent methyltransferase
LSDTAPAIKGLIHREHGQHGDGAVSDWVDRWSYLVAPHARVLDVACGRGRHVRHFAARGAHVTGIDRDADALSPLQDLGRMVTADIEGGPWPLPGEVFDAVIVTNYLWRKLFPVLLQSVAPGGVLIYETFGHLQWQHGRPSNPAFLLQPLELIDWVRGQHPDAPPPLPSFQVRAYEDGELANPPRHVQRMVATRSA